MLYGDKRCFIRNSHPLLAIAGAVTVRLQLGLDLGSRAMHKNQPDPQCGEQIDILNEMDEARSVGDQFPAKRDHKGLSSKCVQVGRRLAEPADKGFGLRDRRHVSARREQKNVKV